MRAPIPLALISTGLCCASMGASAQNVTPDDSLSQWRVSCMIRHDKFDYVLPGAMRRNGIDMWVVTDRGRGTQPMARDFGIATVNGQIIYVFFDNGGDRIERIQLGGETDLAEECAAYDHFGDMDELRAIVEERDPQAIGLNYLAIPYETEGLHVADGLTHTDFKFLESELGPVYADRFVSAQHLIAGLSRRAGGERDHRVLEDRRHYPAPRGAGPVQRGHHPGCYHAQRCVAVA